MDRKTKFDHLCDAIKEKRDLTHTKVHVQGAKEELEILKGLDKTDKFQHAVELMSEVIKFVEGDKLNDAVKAQNKAIGPFRMELKVYLLNMVAETSKKDEEKTTENKDKRYVNDKPGTHISDIGGKKTSDKPKGLSEGNDIRQSSTFSTHVSGSELQSSQHEKRAGASVGLGIHESASQKGSNDKILSGDNNTSETANQHSQHITASGGDSRSTSEGNEEKGGRKAEESSNDQISFSKYASQALQRSNPDIADLSDVNRPTKLAERFSELYDNEWTEAFEYLQKKSTIENDAIYYLLCIIQEAYTFCKNTAEQQINNLASSLIRIIVDGQDWQKSKQSYNTKDDSAKDRYLLVQIRKENAEKSLPELKKSFVQNVKKIHQEGVRLPSNPPPIIKYSEKAVELTWWMCVQDPPVYMCPTNDTSSGDKNLYRAYTKSGNVIDFYVWPALRLHRDGGGVLMKGVAQYK